jgi:dolichol kinase
MFNLRRNKKLREEQDNESVKQFEVFASNHLHNIFDPFLNRLSNAFNRQSKMNKLGFLFFFFTLFLLIILITWKQTTII